ncbi:MAG: branched-chain amino acid ABC transporter substrate-binding protein [Candidimonas sp.]|nr:MAG: branched-chain amino acid ABC transporter substrate-binding protein [Candidimonas sp.]
MEAASLRHVIGLSLLALTMAVSSAVYAKPTVKVAFIGPLTGPVSSFGLGARNSADLAIRQYNENPKSKYHYEMVALDDECKANVSFQVATQAASDNSIIAGATHVCSAAAMSATSVYHRYGFPIIVWGAVLPEITEQNYQEVHRVNATMIDQESRAANFMTKLGYKTWVVINDTTDYGKGHYKYFSEALKKRGGKILADFGAPPNQQDFTAELTKVKELNPEVVFCGGQADFCIRVRTQMAKLGINAQMEGTSGIKSEAYTKGLSTQLAEGSIAFLGGAPLDKLPHGKEFSAAYKQQGYAQPPDAYGPFANAAMTLILRAIEKVGPNRKKVLAELNGTKNVDTVVGKVTFDKHGQNMLPLMSAYVVQDGHWVLWEDSAYAKGQRKLKGLS